MFFEGIDLAPRKGASLKRPPFVDNGWRPPSYFPNLSNAVCIGFDTETHERDFDHGPGWARGKSEICGFSLSAQARDGERGSWYFPIRHAVQTEMNFDPATALAYAHSVLNTPHIPKIGANLLFDIGTLAAEGVMVAGPCHDIQFAEALIDEQAFSTSLESLGRKYLGRGKEIDLLTDWCDQAYGKRADQRGNIWRAPVQLVGGYAEQDALMPLEIFQWQWQTLQNEGLADLYHMEIASIPMLIKMRQRGVRVDVEKAQKLYDDLGQRWTPGGMISELYAKLHELTGVTVETVNVPEQVAACFDAMGILYPRTTLGRPSFRKEWLKEQENPVADLINAIREHEKIRDTFIRAYILEGHVNGRIHCQFHPLRSDEGGTKTGRYSSSDPNLQNIPVRSKLGKRIRELFLYDYGHLCWEKDDHSQIEYRMLAHFATGAGADALREEYRQDPTTDYHDRTFARYAEIAGLNIATMSKEEKADRRRPIKNVNFGLIYGQTEKSLAYKAGWDQATTQAFFPAYHTAAPYVRETMRMNAEEVQALGYITTILGRRTRFNMWEPRFHKKGEDRKPALPYEAALRTYGSAIMRAYDYRATNYRFQGSAADCLKDGMLDCWQAGVFDVTGVPLLQVHDELDFSVIDDSPQQREAYAEMRHRLENPPRCRSILRVPLRVDSKRGPSWAAGD